WDRVGPEAVRDQAPLRIVDDLLHQRRAEPEPDAAVHLALDDLRIRDVADVVDANVPHDVDGPRLLVDLDHRDVGPKGVIEVRRVEVRRGFEAWLDPRRQVPGKPEGLGYFLQRLALVGHALDLHLAVLEDDVVARYLQHVGPDAQRLL